MSNEKGFTKVLLVLTVLLIIVAVGLGGYFLGQKKLETMRPLVEETLLDEEITKTELTEEEDTENPFVETEENPFEYLE